MLVVTEAGRRLAGWVRHQRRAVLDDVLQTMSPGGREAPTHGLIEAGGGGWDAAQDVVIDPSRRRPAAAYRLIIGPACSQSLRLKTTNSAAAAMMATERARPKVRLKPG